MVSRCAQVASAGYTNTIHSGARARLLEEEALEVPAHRVAPHDLLRPDLHATLVRRNLPEVLDVRLVHVLHARRQLVKRSMSAHAADLVDTCSSRTLAVRRGACRMRAHTLRSSAVRMRQETECRHRPGALRFRLLLASSMAQQPSSASKQRARKGSTAAWHSMRKRKQNPMKHMKWGTQAARARGSAP
jgi:hypothetical protein